MDGSIVPLIALIALHALITLAYAALTNTREPLLRDQTETGHDAPPRLHITYQLSLLLVRFTIAALAVTALGQALIDSLSIQDAELERALAYLIVLIPTALITLIVGDMVPEAVGSGRAEAIAPWAIYPMKLLIVLLGPVVYLITALSKTIAAFFGSSDKVNVFTEEELMTMLDASEKEGSIENEEKEMIYSVLQFADKTVREVMIPRIDITAIEIQTSFAEALAVFMASGHSRIPVYEDSVDNIRGLLYAKDLLGVQHTPAPGKTIRELMRKAYFVPESKRADVMLKELRSSKIHMAVVVDEYGGTAGIITVEDLIEEIVGDIQDEYDLNEEVEYVELGPNVYRIDAGMNLTDFNDLLEVELPTDDSDTLGGFLFTQLGRVPEVGETLEHGNLTFKVESLDGRRIRKVHITRRVALPPSDEAASASNGVAVEPQPVSE
ncbi:MAG: HlyC/CorC family transporter [Anaerolineae bacterium]|nr:HlyC/CorC family transporter [Anaerolineae bacterium]